MSDREREVEVAPESGLKNKNDDDDSKVDTDCYLSVNSLNTLVVNEKRSFEFSM